MEKKVPKIVGENISDVQKILLNSGIRIEKIKKKIDIFSKSGNVIDVYPKENTKLKSNEMVTLYVSNRKPILVIFLLFFLCVFLGKSTLGRTIINGTEDKVIRFFNISKPTAPIITGGSKLWSKSRVVKVKKDSYAKNGLAYYEYCINTNINKCSWKKTNTKNVEISSTGKWKVIFRAVDKKGRTSSNSNIEEVYIDNNAPIINDVIINNNKIKIKAEDKDSGLFKYYYSIDGTNYNETNKDFTLKVGSEVIYIKVEDNAGNIAMVSVPIKNGSINGTSNSNTTSSNITTAIVGSTSTTTTKVTQKIEYDIPKINLDEIPLKFIFGSDYKLPSYVDFGNDEGTYKCVVEGNEYKDTKTLGIGNHLIVCEAVSKHNKRAMVEKEISVILKSGEEEIWDGWIRLNLSYPDNSTNWQWRISREGEIRDGYENTGWQDYTGPVLVKLDDVKNVYIRYDLLGETYIVAPNGRVAVDIEPDKNVLSGNEKAKVKIFYEKDLETKEYRIGGNAWQKYTGEFEVEKNTLIEARGVRNEKVYDSDGNYLYTKKITGTDALFIGELNASSSGVSSGGNSSDSTFNYEVINRNDGIYTTKPEEGTLPSTYLDGPEIKTNTNELVDNVIVSVIPQETARKIYIKIGSGCYEEYVNPVTVDKNTIIKAYYIRDSDGKTSEISYFYIQNIKDKSKPYVKIDTTPDFLSKNVNSVKVNISGTNYKKLEYSFDGKIYEEYTGEIEIKQSATIYAKGTNDYGETIESLEIVTVNSPKVKDNIEISIDVSPNKDDVIGLINKAKVKITFEKNAINKYYKLGDYGKWTKYTGEFDINENVTIYAYATGINAEGNSKKSIDYLTTGISSPIITSTPKERTQQVKVSIDFASTAEIKRYKIGNGNYVDYNGPFYVYNNETIYAYNKDSLGNDATSELTINNIVNSPNYIILDKGKYYIINLNYPETSKTREYKWKNNGSWREYNNYGILLIKNEYKDDFKNIKDGIKVEDEYGKEIIFTDHYYFVDVPFSEIMENLFMRWDTEKISSPQIIVLPEDVTKETSISIVYNKALVKKLYKIVYDDGDETDWLEYTNPFKVNKNKATIYAKGMTRSENESNVSSKTIRNIDDTFPTIDVYGNFDTPTRKLNVSVNAFDEFGLDLVKWDIGEKDKDYFKTSGNVINNRSSFSITENGKYTLYAVDKVGNETIKIIEITNIDTEAPNIKINILTEKYGTEANIEIDYGDSKNKTYKLGKSGKYIVYNGIINIKSNDVLSYANSDGSLTIYAKGIDEAGNINEVSENIYILDLDAPLEPVIHAGAGYPVLTEYGVKLGSKSYITYDDRDDIVNYYSIDDGITWKVYTGPFEITSGSIKAKSVKKISGLAVEIMKQIDIPADALGPEAYDADSESYIDIGHRKHNILNISKEMIGKSFYLKILRDTGNYDYIYLYFYDTNGKNLNTIKWSRDYSGYANLKIDIPDGCTKISLYNASSSDGVKVANITVTNDPIINSTEIYPKLTQYGVENGYNEVTIDYFSTSVQRLYRINGQQWKNYMNKAIKLKIGDKLEAKGIDKFGVDSNVVSYDSVLPADALGEEAYDDDDQTYTDIGHSKHNIVNISNELQGKAFYINILRDTGNYDYVYLYLYDTNGKILNTIKWSRDYSGYVNIKIDIPYGCSKMSVYNTSTYMGGVRVSNISVAAEPSISPVKYYPTIKRNEITLSQYEVKITYLSYFTKKLYSIDNGSTWLDYTEPIRVKVGDVIKAKAIDKDGKETDISTYTVTGLTDNLDDKVFDNDKTTSIKLSSKQTKSFSLDNVDNEVLRIYTTGIVNTSAYIKLYDKNNKELSSVTLNNDLTTLVIPEGSVKASIYSGTSSLTINEINLRKTENIKDEIPVIETDNTEWSTNKIIDITYPSGYENEYSLDLGNTWNKYIEPITIDKETTIFARTLKDGKVITTNSYMITKIDNEEPTIELNLDETIVEGIDKNISPKGTFGKSGGTVLCKIDDSEITTTKDLAVGNYEIICTATSNSGKTNSVSKNITIIEKPLQSFDTTNGEQTFIAPVSGTYKLETWGAQGGTVSANYRGGYGSYSTGSIHLDKSQVLYINVGGVGNSTSTSASQTAVGGYNGGGNGVNYTKAGRVAGGGGGATHIAFISGVLSSLEQYKGVLSEDGTYYKSEKIIIVSGGGGGAWYFPGDSNYHTVTPGDAGGMTAINSVAWTESSYGYMYASGGTQIGIGTTYATVEGSFGQGASRTSAITAGGGGGFYGGNAGDLVGAGGSGYIGNATLTNKAMYCYNCEESTEESTKTISTTCANEEPTENCAKIGNGYAKITYIGE